MHSLPMSNLHTTDNSNKGSHSGTNSQKSKNWQNKGISGKHTKKNSKTISSVRASKFDPKDTQQRHDEVNQCFHVLSNKSIKLFKKGPHMTSYGLSLDIRIPDRLRAKFTLNVPHEYPNAPIKLHYKRNESSEDHSREELLQLVVKNFNIKARDLLLQKIPIISQLNYLVYRADVLAMPDFRQTNQRERIFYAAFATDSSTATTP